MSPHFSSKNYYTAENKNIKKTRPECGIREKEALFFFLLFSFWSEASYLLIYVNGDVLVGPRL